MHSLRHFLQKIPPHNACSLQPLIAGMLVHTLHWYKDESLLVKFSMDTESASSGTGFWAVLLLSSLHVLSLSLGSSSESFSSSLLLILMRAATPDPDRSIVKN